MDPMMPSNVPSIILFLSGLIQLAIFVWIFVFPILILKKLKEIAELIKK